MLIAVDPGMETGVAVFQTGGGSLSLEGVAQHQGGLEGAWHSLRDIPDDWTIVVEKFSPRPGARSWRLNELEPIRWEGALYARYGERVIFRRPEQRLILRDLKASAAFMRYAGWWRTGGDLGRPDANDANAAIMHALSYLRSEKDPTILTMLAEYQRIERESE